MQDNSGVKEHLPHVISSSSAYLFSNLFNLARTWHSGFNPMSSLRTRRECQSHANGLWNFTSIITAGFPSFFFLGGLSNSIDLKCGTIASIYFFPWQPNGKKYDTKRHYWQLPNSTTHTLHRRGNAQSQLSFNHKTKRALFLCIWRMLGKQTITHVWTDPFITYCEKARERQNGTRCLLSPEKLFSPENQNCRPDGISMNNIHRLEASGSLYIQTKWWLNKNQSEN